MKLARQQHAREASFDLTPMIDVVFLLIIFFTLTSQFSNVSLKPLDLPQELGEKAPQTPSPFTLVLSVSRDGIVTLDDTAYDPAALAPIIANEVRRAGGADALEVVMRGDRMLPASKLEPLINVLSAAGVRKWKLATSGEAAAPRGGN